MDPQEFIELLENPKKVEQKSVEELKRLSLEHPYSQPVQLLYTIRLSQSSEYLFNRQLGKTSLLTDDRTVLFDLFERDGEEEPEEVVEQPEPSQEAPLEVEGKPAEAEPDEPSEGEASEAENEEDYTSEITSSDKPEEETPPKEEASADEDDEALEPEDREQASNEEPVPEQGGQPEPFEEKGEEEKSLSSKDRIKAILEENRRLREQHDSKRKKTDAAPASDMDARINAIKEKLSKLKRPESASGVDAEKPAENEVTVESRKFPKEEEVVPRESDVEGNPSENESPQEKTTTAEGFPEKQRMPSEEAVDEKAGSIAETEEEAPVKDSASDERPLLREDENQEAKEVEKPEAPAPKTEDKDEPSLKGKPEQSPERPGAKGEYSFSEWLRRLEPLGQESPGEAADSPAPADSDTTAHSSGVTSFEKKIQLLDSFVEKLPELKKKRNIIPKPNGPDIQMNKLADEDGSLITETLAKVYIEQKHYGKAIKAYEILKLKYPEKSSFFADQILEIKKLIDSK